jgi:hypothetical protein
VGEAQVLGVRCQVYGYQVPGVRCQTSGTRGWGAHACGVANLRNSCSKRNDAYTISFHLSSLVWRCRQDKTTPAHTGIA